MKNTPAKSMEYKVLTSDGTADIQVYPYLRDENGDKEMWCVSPMHGRSFVVGMDNERFIVSKGNGLSYTTNTFLNTKEMGDGTWGYLASRYAIRDFQIGNEIRALGIKTNVMQSVIELDVDIITPSSHVLRPALLQYSVECPYRISDAPFMDAKHIANALKLWNKSELFSHRYIYAAEVLISNLKILHDNDILHNAINEQNYTWALELVDFEISSSPKYPWESEEYQNCVPDLFDREIIQTYLTICYIAEILKEPVDFCAVDRIFCYYGFDIEKYKCKIE